MQYCLNLANKKSELPYTSTILWTVPTSTVRWKGHCRRVEIVCCIALTEYTDRVLDLQAQSAGTDLAVQWNYEEPM
jgi:hypothetical protein